MACAVRADQEQLASGGRQRQTASVKHGLSRRQGLSACTSGIGSPRPEKRTHTMRAHNHRYRERLSHQVRERSTCASNIEIGFLVGVSRRQAVDRTVLDGAYFRRARRSLTRRHGQIERITPSLAFFGGKPGLGSVSGRNRLSGAPAQGNPPDVESRGLFERLGGRRITRTHRRHQKSTETTKNRAGIPARLCFL